MNIHAKLHPLAVFIHIVGGISILRDGQNQNTWMVEIFSKRSEKKNYKFHLILSFMNIHAKLHPLAVFIHVVEGISIIRDGQNQNTRMVEIFSKKVWKKLVISFIKSCFQSAFKVHCIKHLL